ncbi:MAG: 3-deoxy-7-phosphoheptulonate synthase [Actinobacteria bacterium]|nr:MAG: 3-deoxy-7-phosphoheptulonate synthase [Actinomycetota bacterium]
MMIIMKQGATKEQIDHIIERLHAVGAEAHLSIGKYKTVIGAIGDREAIAQLPLEAFPGVDAVLPILKPFKLVSKEFRGEESILTVGPAQFGGGTFSVIAGPCSIESEEQTMATARSVKAAGAVAMRGGAFKPRSSPYSFQGLGEEGLKMLAAARKETGLPIVTEVLDVRDTALVAEYSDVLQIGARNMQNFLLLTEVGRVGKPVLLKRAFSATIEELLMAAEYVLKQGNTQVILCERGIRTFEPYTRNTLDLSAVPLCKQLSHLPIIVDPSHATGKRELVEPLTLGAAAVGADGAIIEVHPNPEEALCDGPQSLTPDDFSRLMQRLTPVVSAVGKKIRADE